MYVRVCECVRLIAICRRLKPYRQHCFLQSLLFAMMPHPPLRFQVGDPVKCRLPPGHPAGACGQGTVIRLWYIEPGWDRAVPYQVRLHPLPYLVYASEDCPIFIVAADEDLPLDPYEWLFTTGPSPLRLLRHLRARVADGQQPDRAFWFWLRRLVDTAQYIDRDREMGEENTELPPTWAGPIAGPMVPFGRAPPTPGDDESGDEWVTPLTMPEQF